MAGGAAGRAERLMCLLFLIKAQGRRGITRSELREHVADYEKCATDDAFERMLERDKSDLRDMGIVLDVVQRDHYHEDQAAYVLGSGTMLNLPVHFDADELAVLGMAAEAWERGTWSAAAHGALRKLEVFTDVFPAEPTARVRLSTDAQIEPIRAAIRARQSIAFSYRRPGDEEPQLRRIEPWGLLYRQGGWYCVGYDQDREAARVFRTSRISGAISTIGGASAEADPQWPDLVRGSAEETTTIPTELLVLPGHGWTWRSLGAVTATREVNGLEYDVLEAEIPNRDSITAALASAAPEVLVASPVDLQEGVRAQIGGVLNG